MSNVKESVATLNEIADVQDVTTADGELKAVTLVGEGGYRVRITAECESEWNNGHERPISILKVEAITT